MHSNNIPETNSNFRSQSGSFLFLKFGFQIRQSQLSLLDLFLEFFDPGTTNSLLLLLQVSLKQLLTQPNHFQACSSKTKKRIRYASHYVEFVLSNIDSILSIYDQLFTEIKRVTFYNIVDIYNTGSLLSS